MLLQNASKRQADRKKESPEGPGREDQPHDELETEEGDSSGEIRLLRKVAQCLSRTKGLCSLEMMN